MASIGASEVKKHLRDLLDRVAHGEKITITRYGNPVALLIPMEKSRQKLPHEEIVNGMRAPRRRIKAGKLSVREMLVEGQLR